MSTPGRKGNMLVQKMIELESAYRQSKVRMPNDGRLVEHERVDEREREIIRLKYMVQKLEERINVSKVEAENAKRELRNEQDGRKIVEKKLKAVEKESKELKNKMSALRVKLGVANANYNVGKHETEELRKNHQENQIQIARLEERLAAANVDRERLKHPQNPDGSEEVQKKLDTDNKLSKKLKNKIEKLENLREEDQRIIERKEEENRMMAVEINRCRMVVANLETALEMAEMTSQAERASREDFERQNKALRHEKANFDAQIHQYKVKLGISHATKNVNVHQANQLRKQDEKYQFTIQTLEHKLRKANAEIERLKTRNLMTGKTADSLQEHKGRLKKYRHDLGIELKTPKLTDRSEISGWSRNRSTPKGEIGSLHSVGSMKSQGHGQINSKPNSGKRGRSSVP
ncbi:myosin-10-like [Mercenaria mercenaria]|uniref:myosin-10-like n=1 Tax=Mercenaria mercenaria TaxID=6596 RepID=UPI00234E9252|nr:myosin-10-like [Mercenaria mercenaria]